MRTTADFHEGQGVVYRPWSRSGPAEDGVVTGVTDSWVFVRYRGDFTSKATNPADLVPLAIEDGAR